jgi:hypothetical protein
MEVVGPHQYMTTSRGRGILETTAAAALRDAAGGAEVVPTDTEHTRKCDGVLHSSDKQSKGAGKDTLDAQVTPKSHPGHTKDKHTDMCTHRLFPQLLLQGRQGVWLQQGQSSRPGPRPQAGTPCPAGRPCSGPSPGPNWAAAGHGL